MKKKLYIIPFFIIVAIYVFPFPCTILESQAVTVFDYPSDAYLMISRNGKLVGWGNNMHSILGGGRSYCPYFFRKTILENVSWISDNNMYPGSEVFALTKNHELYGLYSMGDGWPWTDYVENGPVHLLDHVSSAAASSPLEAAVTEDGKLMVWKVHERDLSSALHVMDCAQDVFAVEHTLFATDREDNLYILVSDIEEHLGTEEEFFCKPVLVGQNIQGVLPRGNFDFVLLTEQGSLQSLQKTADEEYRISDLDVEKKFVQISHGVLVDEYNRGYKVSAESDELIPAEQGRLSNYGNFDSPIIMTGFGIFFNKLPVPRFYRFLDPTLRNISIILFICAELVLYIIIKFSRPKSQGPDKI